MSDVWFPRKSHHGYFDRGMNRYFNSKSEKAAYMKANKIAEDGSMENELHREKRLVDQINYEREKQGLKPKTRAELVGDSKTRTW